MRKLFALPKGFLGRLGDMSIGLIIGILLSADILIARSIDASKAGVTLWVFLVVGAFIILLQIIPAFILFTSFIAGIHKSVLVKKGELVNVEQAQEEAND